MDDLPWMLSPISQNNFTNVNVKFQNNIVNDKSHYFDFVNKYIIQSIQCMSYFVCNPEQL